VSFVIGRESDRAGLPAGKLGRYRAVDGSQGATLYLDFDGPHAVLVVGKRGYGKSYTLGVVAESLAETPGVAPVVLDPMGAFRPLADAAGSESVPATVIDQPTVRADSLDPRSWCSLLGLDPESGAGGLLWRGAREGQNLEEMRTVIEGIDAGRTATRSALNHVDLAQSWGVFGPQGLSAGALGTGEVSVLDLSGLDEGPMNAVCRGVCDALYRARVDDELGRLPWLLVDEVHAFFDGVAGDALARLLTRGRAPGVSLVAATQRPSAVPEVAVSQSDVLVAHRLTSRDDIEALRAAQPTYLNGPLEERLPGNPGEVVIVDDATETVHTARIRERRTPHGGGSPSVAATLEGVE
jgi:hypothetical protein